MGQTDVISSLDFNVQGNHIKKTREMKTYGTIEDFQQKEIIHIMRMTARYVLQQKYIVCFRNYVFKKVFKK